MIDRLEGLDRVDRNKLGMLIFIASETVFFALLVLTFVYYRGRWIDRPGSGAEHLDLGLTALFTSLLLASSLTIWRAERQARRGRPAATRRWLAITVALGALFLAGQAYEYLTLLTEGVTISSSLFGATFFTLTGFHGLHVLGGLVTLTILLGLAQVGAGSSRRPNAGALETTALYWHFVDVVWIIVFSVVYLWTGLA